MQLVEPHRVVIRRSHGRRYDEVLQPREPVLDTLGERGVEIAQAPLGEVGVEDAEAEPPPPSSPSSVPELSLLRGSESGSP